MLQFCGVHYKPPQTCETPLIYNLFPSDGCLVVTFLIGEQKIFEKGEEANLFCILILVKLAGIFFGPYYLSYYIFDLSPNIDRDLDFNKKL